MDKTAKEIRKEMDALQAQLKYVELSEKNESLKNDIVVQDYIDDLKKSFAVGQYDDARNLAAKLFRSLGSTVVTQIELNAQKHLDGYKSKSETIRMPESWGFVDSFSPVGAVKHGIELERGLPYSIGARPGVGKSSVAINLAYHYVQECLDKNYRVLVMTNEMKVGQLWVKMRQVDLARKMQERKSFMVAKDWVRYPDKFPEQYAEMQGMIKQMEPRLCMTSVRKMQAESICLVIDEAKNYFGRYPDVVMLDYLQRVPRDAKYKTDARLAMVDTMQMLTEKMGDTDGVMFIFSQLNKEGGFKESEIPEEESGIAWEISREKLTDGSLSARMEWRIKKSRISPYFKLKVPFDDESGSIIIEGKR